MKRYWQRLADAPAGARSRVEVALEQELEEELRASVPEPVRQVVRTAATALWAAEQALAGGQARLAAHLSLEVPTDIEAADEFVKR
jgi:hypothetical protein